MTFKQFNLLLIDQFAKMQQYGQLFVSSVNPDTLWDLYLLSFNAEDNPVFRHPESTSHNCNLDKHFVRRYGNIVAIDENYNIVTLWEVVQDRSNPYYNSCKAMYNAIKEAPIANVFVESFNYLNVAPYESTNRNATQFRLNQDVIRKIYKPEETYGNVEAGKVYEFNLFHVFLNKQFVDFTNKSVESIQGDRKGSFDVFKRGLSEIPLDTLELVRDLISQGSLLNAESHKYKVEEFIKLKKEYDAVQNKVNYCWVKSNIPIARFRNELIGTLCVELAEGKEINESCKSWNYRVDPANYMKAVAPITSKQKEEAIKVIQELGYEEAFNRRLVTLDDINVSEIKHFNGDHVVKQASIFDKVQSVKSTRHKRAEFDGIEEVSIDKFMNDILPTVTSIEAFVENRMENNFAVLHTATTDKHPFKWSNPFGWTYNGNLAGKSQIAENVKSAGGNIVAKVRCSLQWNDVDTPATVDFDLHCQTPHHEIYYGSKDCRMTGGNLDVDMIRPSKVGIENITWKSTPKDGVYKFWVKNFDGANNKGFKVEIDLDGETYNYHYTGNAMGTINVATLTVKNGKYEIQHHLPETSSSKDIWNVKTGEFSKVNLVCLSPNYWGDNNVGNKHYFFMLEGCKTPSAVKGFHAEFLNQELSQQPTRRFIDIFGNFHQIEPNEKHLAGLGFNATVKDELIVKLSGTFKRTIKIKF